MTQTSEYPRGTLVAIGGGDYEQTEPIDRFMLERAGGPDAAVVMLPSARPSQKMGEKFVQYYTSLGARDVRVAPVNEREDAFKQRNVDMLRSAHLIFLAWGAGNRLIDVVGGTPAQDAIYDAYQRGAVLACMSAGARAAGEVCIARGTGVESLREAIQPLPLREDGGSKGPIQLVQGFRWAPGIVFEPHMGEWNRYGHFLLMASVLPELTWIGIDERTAVVFHPDQRVEVMGLGNVFVSRRAKPDKVAPPAEGRPLEAWNLRMDIWAHGVQTTASDLRRQR